MLICVLSSIPLTGSFIGSEEVIREKLKQVSVSAYFCLTLNSITFRKLLQYIALGKIIDKGKLFYV